MAGNLGGRDGLARFLRLAQSLDQSFPNIRAEGQAFVGVSQHFTQLILHHLSNKGLEFLNGELLNRRHWL